MAGLKQEGYISCQGESGSCAFGASRTHYFNFTAAPQPSFEEVVRRVVERDAVLGILPMQNSRSGLIDEPLTLLAKSDLFIVGEHHQRIKHHLMAPKIWVESVLGKDALVRLENNLPGDELAVDQIRRALLAQITTVYSDEQGLKQCDRGLKIKLSGADRHLTTCTAKAARMVSHETDGAKLKEREIPGLAAIASEDCATMFKNVMLVPEINDDKNNETRYVVVSRDEIKPAQMLADIDVKAILHAFEGEEGKAALKVLFRAIEKLESEYQRVASDFSLGGAAEEAGQERAAQARVLQQYLGETEWPKISAELEKLGDDQRMALTLKLQPLAKQVHDHALKMRGKTADEAILRMLRSKPYQSRQRSIFIIRAKDPKKTVADLLRPFVPPLSRQKKKDDQIVFHVLAELPKPIDSKDEGIGLIIDAEGCLIGAQKRLKHKKTHSGSFFASAPSVEVSDLERALQQLVKFADIRVLGTFAKEQGHLGAPSSVKKASTGTAVLPAPGKGVSRRGDGGSEAVNASGAGAIAALLALAAGAAGVYWYSSHIGF